MIRWLIFFLSVLLASLITKETILKIRKKLTPKNQHKNNLVFYLGFLELLSYSVSFIIFKPEFIVFWLGIKSLNRWEVKRANADNNWENNDINIFLLGNLLSIIFSFIIGKIFTGLLQFS